MLFDDLFSTIVKSIFPFFFLLLQAVVAVSESVAKEVLQGELLKV